MPLEVVLCRPFQADNAASDLVDTLRSDSGLLGLDDAVLYYGYPRYRNDDDELVAAQILLMSPEHGIAVFGTLNSAGRPGQELEAAELATETVLASVYSRLLANKARRRPGAVTLRFPVAAYLYAPYAPHLGDETRAPDALDILTTHASLRDRLSPRTVMEDAVYAQLMASIDGTRSIPRPKKRDLEDLEPLSKGRLVAQLEGELARFDTKQREGSTTVIAGPQRIRGLAGSGKTIVLTRKAALTHLENPDAKIAYTFHTKSLYQQIRRLITRFYRSEHDRDPDWDHVSVLHSWGAVIPVFTPLRACATAYALCHMARPRQRTPTRRLATPVGLCSKPDLSGRCMTTCSLTRAKISRQSLSSYVRTLHER
jgi:superfamily I DNA and RNA helicase